MVVGASLVVVGGASVPSVVVVAVIEMEMILGYDGICWDMQGYSGICEGGGLHVVRSPCTCFAKVFCLPSYGFYI